MTPLAVAALVVAGAFVYAAVGGVVEAIVLCRVSMRGLDSWFPVGALWPLALVVVIFQGSYLLTVRRLTRPKLPRATAIGGE